MQVHGGEHGFTQLLLSMGVPGLDWPRIDRRDAILTEDERSSGSRSLESRISRSSGGFHGGGADELGFRSRRVAAIAGGHSSEEEISTSKYATPSQSTHPAHKRPYESADEDDPLDAATTSPPVSPKEPDTWVKRPRFGEIPDFRTAKNGRKSTLELKLRKFGNRNSDEIVVPEPGMEFDCLPEAFDFFNLYSWEVGFGIKYGASRRNKQGSLTMQEFLCGCAGSPRHDKTKSSACGCKAMIRLRRTDDHGWFIHVFRKDHNHSMSLSCGEKMQWPSHKNIDPHTKASLHCRWTGIRCNAACLVDGLGKLPWKPLATDGTGKSILSVAALTLVRHREDCAGAASWAVATGDSHGSGFYIFLYFSIWAHIISQPPVFVSVLHGGHHRRPHIFSGCRRISVVEI